MMSNRYRRGSARREKQARVGSGLQGPRGRVCIWKGAEEAPGRVFVWAPLLVFRERSSEFVHRNCARD